MGWTSWRLLARKGEWFDDDCNYDGPTCYELSVCGPRGGGREIVYCGHTKNERQRMSSYGRDGSHLSRIIQQHLRDGWSLEYRACACASKADAEAMERRMLRKFDYPWNLMLNG